MTDVLDRIDEQVKKNAVMIYMKGTPQFPQCGFSGRTVAAPIHWISITCGN